MQKSRVRAIKLKGWRMVWHERMRGEGDNTTDDCCWQLRKRVNTGKKTFCVAQNYVYYYSRILLARCNEGWFLYIWESRVKKRMPVRRIKICCYEVNLFKTLFLFLVCFLFNFFVDDFCPIFEVTTSTNEAVLLLNFSLPLAKKRFCTEPFWN